MIVLWGYLAFVVLIAVFLIACPVRGRDPLERAWRLPARDPRRQA